MHGNIRVRLGYTYRDTPVTEIEEMFGLQPLHDRRKCTDLVFLHKLVSGLLDSPSLLSDINILIPTGTRSRSVFLRINLKITLLTMELIDFCVWRAKLPILTSSPILCTPCEGSYAANHDWLTGSRSLCFKRNNASVTDSCKVFSMLSHSAPKMFFRLLLFTISIMTAELSEIKCIDGDYKLYPYDCAKFMQCDHGGWVVRDCEPGTHWNPAIEKCDWPYKVDCKAVSADISETKCMDGQYEPYPFDCAKFKQCDHGRWLVRDCGPGTHWNQAIKTCDWPYNVDCTPLKTEAPYTTVRPYPCIDIR
ncbi:Belongs to the glycosyl hydrolase 18 [Homalodisca vitripennis]|nr:Belongs to the glycosyl hydrolase 18 [Homalodisca vitripennis]